MSLASEKTIGEERRFGSVGKSMARTTKYSFRMDPSNAMEGILKAWDPKGGGKRRPASEKAYEKGLVNELRKRLSEGHTITPQSGRGLSKCDILVTRKRIGRLPREDAIELKKGIDRSILKTLRGQIDDYRRKYNGFIIAVICGEHVEQTSLDELKNRYTEPDTDRICIFHKRDSTGPKSVTRVV